MNIYEPEIGDRLNRTEKNGSKTESAEKRKEKEDNITGPVQSGLAAVLKFKLTVLTPIRPI